MTRKQEKTFVFLVHKPEVKSLEIWLLFLRIGYFWLLFLRSGYFRHYWRYFGYFWLLLHYWLPLATFGYFWLLKVGYFGYFLLYVPESGRSQKNLKFGVNGVRSLWSNRMSK